MTNTHLNIIGKVNKGRVTITIATPGRIMGKSYRIAPSHTAPMVQAPTYQPIESPFIQMANDNYKNTHHTHMVYKLTV